MNEILQYSAGIQTVLVIAEESSDSLLAGVAVAGMTAVGPIGPRDLTTGRAVPSASVILADLRPLEEDPTLSAIVMMEQHGQEHGAPVVALVHTRQIELAATAWLEPPNRILCDPTVADIVLALASMPNRTRNAVAGDDAHRLRQLNSEVARIAETLARLTQEENERWAGAAPARSNISDIGPPPEREHDRAESRSIRNLIRARRARDSYFPAELFADPAWDMLLDLYAAELEERRVSVSSLCIAASVPGTTALRWIGTMVELGLLERHADPADRRRAYITLSDRSREGMKRYFDAIERAGLFAL